MIENATKNEIKFKSNMTRGNFAILGNVHKSKVRIQCVVGR